MKSNSLPPNKRSKLVQFEEVCISDKLRIGAALPRRLRPAPSESPTPNDSVYKVDNVIICTGLLYPDDPNSPGAAPLGFFVRDGPVIGSKQQGLHITGICP